MKKLILIIFFVFAICELKAQGITPPYPVSNNNDSITAHNDRLNTLVDSVTSHDTRINTNVDSITAHNDRLNTNADSITSHNDRINDKFNSADTTKLAYLDKENEFTNDVIIDSTITANTYKQTGTVTIADSVINCNLSNTFQKTLGANQRFVLENIGDGQTINIAVTNTADNYTVLFVDPSGLTIKWADSLHPTQTVGAKTDVLTFVRIGTVIYGNSIQNF
jgi:hypothetical protein